MKFSKMLLISVKFFYFFISYDPVAKYQKYKKDTLIKIILVILTYDVNKENRNIFLYTHIGQIFPAT